MTPCDSVMVGGVWFEVSMQGSVMNMPRESRDVMASFLDAWQALKAEASRLETESPDERSRAPGGGNARAEERMKK